MLKVWYNKYIKNIEKQAFLGNLGVAQFGSVLEWGSRGRKFKSSHPDQKQSIDDMGCFCFYMYILSKDPGG